MAPNDAKVSLGMSEYLETVEFLGPFGEWDAGTVGTVVEILDAHTVLVEVSDDDGHGLDFLPVPRNLTAARAAAPEAVPA